MAEATIVFTDSVGTATLRNAKPAPGWRFANWVPIGRPIGESANRQSDLALSMFKLVDSFGASFELRGIPVKAATGVRLVDVADRLIYHLLNGGTCAVTTGDVDSSTYATCGLMPGTSPSLTMTDSRLLEYTLALALINLAGSPARMVCHYV
jgi:hypothetical protein